MRTDNQKLGAWGEAQASLFLQAENYKIVNTNFEKHNVGEIDIIAWFEDILCFIEVKTRQEEEDGSAERATEFEKKVKKMLMVAEYYCLINNIDVDHTRMRFEHVSVYVDKATKKTEIKRFVLPT